MLENYLKTIKNRLTEIQFSNKLRFNEHLFLFDGAKYKLCGLNFFFKCTEREIFHSGRCHRQYDVNVIQGHVFPLK